LIFCSLVSVLFVPTASRLFLESTVFCFPPPPAPFLAIPSRVDRLRITGTNFRRLLFFFFALWWGFPLAARAGLAFPRARVFAEVSISLPSPVKCFVSLFTQGFEPLRMQRQQPDHVGNPLIVSAHTYSLRVRVGCQLVPRPRLARGGV
jgi:hypothetical protein